MNVYDRCPACAVIIQRKQLVYVAPSGRFLPLASAIFYNGFLCALVSIPTSESLQDKLTMTTRVQAVCSPYHDIPLKLKIHTHLYHIHFVTRNPNSQIHILDYRFGVCIEFLFRVKHCSNLKFFVRFCQIGTWGAGSELWVED